MLIIFNLTSGLVLAEYYSNYRFENEFIKQAVFLEITSKVNVSSIWFLLPDNTLLLKHVESYRLDETKVLNMGLKKYGNNIQLPFPCLLFDKNGNLIEK